MNDKAKQPSDHIERFEDEGGTTRAGELSRKNDRKSEHDVAGTAAVRQPEAKKLNKTICNTMPPKHRPSLSIPRFLTRTRWLPDCSLLGINSRDRLFGLAIFHVVAPEILPPMLDVLPIGLVVFPGSGITDNLADKAKKLGVPVSDFSTYCDKGGA